MSQIKVLELKDSEGILAFENQRLRDQIADEADREIASWHASWRKESLDHYLPLGWSFGIFKDQDLLGYFLAQPLLFASGLTQTMWLEHVSALETQTFVELIEVAYRIAKEKHFQRVLIRAPEVLNPNQGIFQLQRLDENIFELKTAKY